MLASGQKWLFMSRSHSIDVFLLVRSRNKRKIALIRSAKNQMPMNKMTSSKCFSLRKVSTKLEMNSQFAKAVCCRDENPKRIIAGNCKPA